MEVSKEMRREVKRELRAEDSMKELKAMATKDITTPRSSKQLSYGLMENYIRDNDQKNLLTFYEMYDDSNSIIKRVKKNGVETDIIISGHKRAVEWFKKTYPEFIKVSKRKSNIELAKERADELRKNNITDFKRLSEDNSAVNE